MIKQFVFLIGILVATFTPPGGERVSVTQVVPASVKAGEEFQLELVISKVGISGYGKAQSTLPRGFVALDDGSKGALVRQDDNVLKLIWMELPETDLFSARLRMLVDPEMKEGDYTFNFRFAYLEGNQKRSVSSVPVSIKVLPPPPDIMAKLKEEQERSKPAVMDQQSAQNLNQVIAESGVGCTMVSERKSETEHLINLKIQKGSVIGFGKVEVPVCDGLIATNISNEKGVFSFADGKVKYVWTDMPESPVLNLSFKLLRGPQASQLTACSIDGEFSYLDQDQSKKCKVNVVNLNYVPDDVYAKMSAAQAAAETTASEPVKTDSKINASASGEVAAESTGSVIPVNAQVQAQNDQLANSSGVSDNAKEKSAENKESSSASSSKKTEMPASGDESSNSQSKISGSQEANSSGSKTEAISGAQENPTKSATAAQEKQTSKETSGEEVSVSGEELAQEKKDGEGKSKKWFGKRDKKSAESTNASVIFKVQVCATHRDRTAMAIQSHYKLTEEVTQEMHEGWFKFTVGGFSEYNEAREKREELSPLNLPGPFVTAYQAGTRITVQEALMITRQTRVK